MKRIPNVFFADRRSAGRNPDPAIQRHSKRFLRRIASDLRLRKSEHEIVLHEAGQHAGARAVLRAPGLLLEVGQACPGADVRVAFRTRASRSDMAGGRSNAVSFEQLSSPHGYCVLLDDLRLLSGTER